MPEAPSRAKEHSSQEWERIKPRFCELYCEQNMTLPEVKVLLKYHENFDASEKQYKNKIKLWNLRKNATPEEYALFKELIQSRSPTQLSDFFTSRNIPITDKKMRRCLMNKGKDVPAKIKSEILSPRDGTGSPSSIPLRADDVAANSWSPSVADETSPEPGARRPSNRLTELFRELTENEDHVDKLEQRIGHLKKLIHSETASPKACQEGAAALQDNSNHGVYTSPRQSTHHQHNNFGFDFRDTTRTAVKPDRGAAHAHPFFGAPILSPCPWEGNGDDETASMSTVPLNSNEESSDFFSTQSYDLFQNFGSMAADTAVGGNSLLANQGNPSLNEWVTSPMTAPTPQRTMPTLGFGLLAYAGEELIPQRGTMSSRAAASRCSSAHRKPYLGE